VGNDAIRFRNCLRALAPELGLITPLRELGLRGPADDVRYAREHGLPAEEGRETLYNVEENLWGANIQLRTQDPWAEPPREAFRLTAEPDAWPEAPGEAVLGFEKGIPVTLNGRPTPPVPLIQALNRLGGAHGVGRFDMVENRITGHKTREIYEAPAAAILYAAHRALESVVLDRDLMHFQEPLRLRYADLVYEGHWFTLFREGLDAFFTRTQEQVGGTVACRLHRGRAEVLRVDSPNARFGRSDATTILPVPVRKGKDGRKG
jgi:argininosuccinate synthase